MSTAWEELSGAVGTVNALDTERTRAEDMLRERHRMMVANAEKSATDPVRKLSSVQQSVVRAGDSLDRVYGLFNERRPASVTPVTPASLPEHQSVADLSATVARIGQWADRAVDEGRSLGRALRQASVAERDSPESVLAPVPDDQGRKVPGGVFLGGIVCLVLFLIIVVIIFM